MTGIPEAGPEMPVGPPEPPDVKTLYPFCSHQNSWDLWMFIPLKMVLIGIDPYPHDQTREE